MAKISLTEIGIKVRTLTPVEPSPEQIAVAQAICQREQSGDEHILMPDLNPKVAQLVHLYGFRLRAPQTEHFRAMVTWMAEDNEDVALLLLAAARHLCHADITAPKTLGALTVVGLYGGHLPAKEDLVKLLTPEVVSELRSPSAWSE